MAAARVFAIQELTTMILLRLPTKELLISKRVCRAFRDAHNDSAKIKKALFLIPGNANDTSDDASYPMPRYSAPLSRLEKLWNNWRSFGIKYEVPLPETAKYGVSFNPLLVERFTGSRLGVPISLARDPDHRPHPVFFNTSLIRAGTEASCRRMFVTQPPLRVVTTDISTRFPTGRYEYQKKVWRDHELFGMLLSEMEDALQGFKRSKECVVQWEFNLRSVRKGETS